MIDQYSYYLNIALKILLVGKPERLFMLRKSKILVGCGKGKAKFMEYNDRLYGWSINPLLLFPLLLATSQMLIFADDTMHNASNKPL